MAVMSIERSGTEYDTHSRMIRRRRALVVRDLHDQLDPPAGWRVEIIEGELIVSPAPMPAHGYIVEIIRTALAGCLDPTHGTYENIEFEEPETDRYIPDLAVWLREPLRGLTDRPNPAFCTLVVEVTSPDQSKRDYAKAQGFARCEIPAYLLVDRSRGVCVVFTEPADGWYLNRHETPFGKPVTLPLDPPVTIETTDF